MKNFNRKLYLKARKKALMCPYVQTRREFILYTKALYEAMLWGELVK